METIDHLRLRYEHVGLPGQPCSCLSCTYWQSFNIRYGCATWLVAKIIDGGYIPVHDYQFLTFNVIGSPFGSSSKLNDDNFPEYLTLRDIVRAIELGIQALEFKKINILIGGSLGGMQAMELLYNRQFEVEKQSY